MEIIFIIIVILNQDHQGLQYWDIKVIGLHIGGHLKYHSNLGLLVKNAIDEFINEKENNNIRNIKLKNSSINDNKIKIEQEKIKIIDINEALKKEKENSGLFSLGFLAKFLKNNGIDSIIEINEFKDEKDTLTSNFLFIINGASSDDLILANYKKNLKTIIIFIMFKSNKYDNLNLKDLKFKFKNENNFNLKEIISQELIPIKLSINSIRLKS